MNLSLSVLLTILFLAPGFAGYFGLIFAMRGSPVRRAPPQPNSLTFLVAIAACALVAHGTALMSFAAQDLYCRRYICLDVGFEPDGYARLAAIMRGGGFRSASLFYELFWVGALCVAAFHLTRALATWDLRRGERSYLAAFVYRWLAPILGPARLGDAWVTGYVLTKMRHEGFAIGYRGVLSEVSLNSDGELSSITLAYVERFGLRLAPAAGAEKSTVTMSGLLGAVHIPGHEIENVVLAAAPFGEAEA